MEIYGRLIISRGGEVEVRGHREGCAVRVIFRVVRRAFNQYKNSRGATAGGDKKKTKI